jgi:hypothetical protein
MTSRLVAEDHAVLPILVVRVELGPCLGINAVKIVEEVDLRRALGFARSRLPAQILDQGARVDFLLNVNRRRGDL